MRVKQFLKNQYIELIVLMIYIILYIIISYFHEPWLDEAQAWEIGKTASLYEMLFVVPHTEGHPALWSLILAIPARMGVPYLWGIKVTAFFFSIISIVLFEFKSPFPRIVKILYPFTYFSFYQYGVISRTYCLMTVAFMLIAVFFSQKDERPTGFVISILFLCLTSAYGLVIAGAICFSWVLDIVPEYIKKGKLVALIRDRRIWYLFTTLIFAIVVAIEILPYKNTFATNHHIYNGFLQNVIYAFLVMAGDSVTSNTFPLAWENMTLIDFIPGMITEIIIFAYILCFFNKKSIKYYILPYLAFATFSSYYVAPHHTGIMILILMFYLWSSYNSVEIAQKRNYIMKKCNTDREKRLVNGAIKLIPILLMLISVCYSLISAFLDIKYPYDSSKEIAGIIKENNWEDAIIFVDYSEYEKNDEGEVEFNYFRTEMAATISPYFEDNIFVNHNVLDKTKGYALHIVPSEEEIGRINAKIVESGMPDIIIGGFKPSLVYGSDFSLNNYTLIKKVESRQIFKGGVGYNTTSIFVKDELVD